MSMKEIKSSLLALLCFTLAFIICLYSFRKLDSIKKQYTNYYKTRAQLIAVVDQSEYRVGLVKYGIYKILSDGKLISQKLSPVEIYALKTNQIVDINVRGSELGYNGLGSLGFIGLVLSFFLMTASGLLIFFHIYEIIMQFSKHIGLVK